jgi:hypothetical protein
MKHQKTLTNNMRLNLKYVFHIVGLSGLFGAVSLMCLTFYGISTQGYFLGVESRLWIRYPEIGLTIFDVIYILYLIAVYIKVVLKL